MADQHNLTHNMSNQERVYEMDLKLLV